jgi:hypothetical protein
MFLAVIFIFLAAGTAVDQMAHAPEPAWVQAARQDHGRP